MFRGIFREILYIYRITLKLSIMALTEKMELRTVTGITQADFNAIYYFLQGAIYCWCKAKREEWFTVQDLLGGENFYWEGTPLIALYRKHKDTLGKDWETAVQDARKDTETCYPRRQKGLRFQKGRRCQDVQVERRSLRVI